MPKDVVKSMKHSSTGSVTHVAFGDGGSDGDETQKLIQAGIEAYKAHDFNLCMSSLRSALSRKPNNQAALLYLARAARAVRDWSCAEESASALLKISPWHERALEIAGEAASRLSNWTAVTSYYQKLLKFNHNRPDFFVAAARSLANEGRWKEALDAANSALKRWPQNQAAIILALRSAIHVDDFKRGSPLWAGLARLDSAAVIRWMRILARQTRFEWAAAAFAGLLEGRGTTMEIRLERDWLVGFLSQAAANTDEVGARAERTLVRLLRDLPAGAMSSDVEGSGNDTDSTDAQVGQNRAAAQRPSRSSEPSHGNPAHCNTRMDLADQRPLEVPLGADSTGLQKAWLGPSAPPPNEVAFGSTGDSASLQKTPLGPSASPPNKENSAFGPQMRRHLQSQFQAARTADREGRYDEVIRLLEDADLLPKHAPDALKLLGRAYWFSNNRARALDYWRRAAEQLPDDATSWLFIARGCKSLRLWDEGRTAALRLLQLRPGDDKAEKLISEFDRAIASKGGRA